MTNRLKYPNFWAQSGTAKDPDTDTTHPSYIANRYASLGWKSEKPPEFWENFLYQITDQKVIAFITDGIPTKDTSVTYSNGAIYQDAGKYYVVEGGTAKEILSVNKAIYETALAALAQLLDGHLSASNPHKDTVNTLVDKSYIKTDVDKMFGDPTDPGTIVYHTNLTQRAHNETPQQLGTLPVAGGTFTGQVGFLLSALMAGTPTKKIHLDKTTALLTINCGNFSLGLDSTGAAWVGNASGRFKVLTEILYSDFNIANGYAFALPLPFISMNIAQDLNDVDSTGLWTMETTTDPVFVAGKGMTVASGITLDGVAAPANATLVVRGWTATAASVAVKDIAAVNYTTLAALITASGVAFTQIAQIWIYPRLTANQKSMLVTK